VYSRLLEPFLERTLGAEIVIDNIPGASGLIGLKTLVEADADGRTLGILNAPGFLMASLSGATRAPNPVTGVSILGRVARSRHVWATGARSGFGSIEDVLREGEKRRLVFGIGGVGGVSFVDIAVTSFLLGLEVEFVSGFRGSRVTSLAAVRGDVDLVAFSLDAIVDRIEAGDLRPLLQISDQPISLRPSIEQLPLLGGRDGLAVRRAAHLGRSVKEAREDASALASFIGAGRVIAASPGLEEGLLRCLARCICDALTDTAFAKAAAASGRVIDVACADVARDEISAAHDKAGRFLPIVREALKRARGG
jgi:hypothetical protein